LTRKEKEKTVAWLREQFQGVTALILTDFQGLTVEEMNALRSELRQAGISYKVLKNTLARLAYADTSVALLADDIVGPRAAAWTDDDDQIQPMAKVLTSFSSAHPNLGVVRGLVSGSLLDPSDVELLSKLPGRLVLLGRVLGTMIAPVGSFVNTLAAVPRSFLNVLKAIEAQKDTSSESVAG
jgi:large subunit ribosomal protein L10